MSSDKDYFTFGELFIPLFFKIKGRHPTESEIEIGELGFQWFLEANDMGGNIGTCDIWRRYNDNGQVIDEMALGDE